MKLAIVRQRYTPFGGAERFVERALAALETDGDIELTLICRQWQGTVENTHRRIVTCNPGYAGRLWRDRSFARCARAHFAAYDLVQSHERIPGCQIYRAGDGVHAAWLSRLGAARGAFGRALLAAAPYHRYVVAAEAAMFRDPALRTVICNSRLVADEIVAHYGVDRDKLAVIPNGVDLERFHPRLADEFRASIRQQLGIPATAPLFLFVGSGFERKGVARLLAATAQLARQDIHLVIVGNDRRLAAMRTLAARLGLAERVVFTGGVADPRPYYGAADAFVLPTLYDPFPNAALEALACGLPLLTTDGCGAAEYVGEGINGYVVPALDVGMLAARLATLAERAGEHAPREAARRSVEGLSLATLSDSLQSLYRRLLAA